jgi:putative ABC transport system substrate-binding protein
MIQRREFITLIGGAAAASPMLWSGAAGAQQPAMPVIGYLHISFPEPYANQVAAFRKGLSEAGFVEGRNVVIEFRWAQNDSDRLPELAADLVRRRVTVIATPGGPAAAVAPRQQPRPSQSCSPHP